MLIIPQKVKVSWGGKNKKHYVDKGITYTKFGDEFEVDVLDLTLGSHAWVKFICDYCYLIKERRYKDYLRKRKNSTLEKDCCDDCGYLKSLETIEFVYGVKSQFEREEVQIKIKSTINSVYGVDNVLQSQEIQEKRKITIQKMYGVDHISKSPIIKAKKVKTMYKHGTTPTSSQQVAIHDILKEQGYNVDLNLPVNRVSIDVPIFINNQIKIALEYDGWRFHKDTQQEDRRKDEFLKSQGWKILRVKSGHKIPTLEQLTEAINKLILTDRTFTQIILPDWGEN